MTSRPRPLVLLIDDDDDTREVCAYVLRREGFAVAEARDGQQGVARAVEVLPDVIVTDLAMPVLNGWDTIRRLRGDYRTHHIPIIACSGHDDAGVVDLGADALLGKPCPVHHLVREVWRLSVLIAAPPRELERSGVDHHVGLGQQRHRIVRRAGGSK